MTRPRAAHIGLSVVIPTYREAPRIAESVQLAWALQPLEVVVADGGSDDGTAQLAERSGARVVPCSLGRGVQLQAACAVCSGEAILMLHADTWLRPDARQQLDAAFADSRVISTFFRQRIEHPAWSYRWLERANACRGRWWGLPYGDQGIAVRRTVLEGLGGMPPLPLMEDVLLMRKLRRHAYPRQLAGPLMVDPRRWLRHGILRQTLTNWSLLAAWHLGVAPATLARWYQRSSRVVDR